MNLSQNSWIETTAHVTTCPHKADCDTARPFSLPSSVADLDVSQQTAVATTALSTSTPTTSTSQPVPATPSPTKSSSQQPQCQSRIRNLVRVCGRDGSSICRTAQKSTSGGTSNKAIDGNFATSMQVSSSVDVTDPWWRVELLALSSVFNVTLTLPGSATSRPLSMYVGTSTDYRYNSLCAAISPSSVKLQVPCSGVGRYLTL